MKLPIFLVSVLFFLFLCEKFKLRQKYQVNRNFRATSHYPYFAVAALFLYIFCKSLVHGKFSINCYSFNFMHESCLKGKMLVDQPPSFCHQPLYCRLPKRGKPPENGKSPRPLLRLKLRYSKTFTAQTEMARLAFTHPLESFIVLILLTGQAAKAFAHCLPFTIYHSPFRNLA